MADTKWRRIAGRLAARLANHAFCEEHPVSRPSADCPSCEDRSAYAAYVAAGGTDTRLAAEFAGIPSVPLHLLPPSDHFVMPGARRKGEQE